MRCTARPVPRGTRDTFAHARSATSRPRAPAPPSERLRTRTALATVRLEELDGTGIARAVARVVAQGELPEDDGTFRAPAIGA